jgi:hypothetical protein
MQVPIHVLSDDSVFGENGLLGMEREASIVAVSYCDTLALGQQSFMRIMEDQPNFGLLMELMHNRGQVSDILPDMLSQLTNPITSPVSSAVNKVKSFSKFNSMKKAKSRTSSLLVTPQSIANEQPTTIEPQRQTPKALGRRSMVTSSHIEEVMAHAIDTVEHENPPHHRSSLNTEDAGKGGRTLHQMFKKVVAASRATRRMAPSPDSSGNASIEQLAGSGKNKQVDQGKFLQPEL